MTPWTASRLVKLAISCIVRSGDYVSDALRHIFGAQRPNCCVVLYYHEVATQRRRQFARQLDTIIRYAVPISLNDPPPPGRGGRYVAVTFDDGFTSVLENALPELEQRAIPSTLFVVAGAIGQPRNWVTRSAHDSSVNERVMSSDQLTQLSTLVTIGSHSLTHPFLPTVAEPIARRELNESRRVLESAVGRKVDLFSFPYGGFNAELVTWCAEAGYTKVFTTQPVYAFVESDEFVTGRVPVSPDDTPLEFRLKILGAYRWLPYAVALKSQLRRAIVRDTKPQFEPRGTN